ncbi:hypothetical protein P153DRAFT_176619 [Dothidotthia symphoricarpi CBS 119687]|uniref:Uncharacterized protein n=1 Tax=Dothidotthia symphoricarpi CBS 119687 TaxID=1392245 RepID=A0A6A6APQ5_9PLEO|nr:uncharacterized protein P153DRAFT_176619 [Dothidotthia symphoricarpi CBS 119687]KAF2132924.1 hypothetical protein P153DRAFT_176619 [Dothidotthia symphoricarpi CBS 119687]
MTFAVRVKQASTDTKTTSRVTTMPSLLKKLIYGKKLSNPYADPYHPSHTHTSDPKASSTSGIYAQPPEHLSNHGHAKSFPSSTRVVAPPQGSKNSLAEARAIAGRDPVTGQRVPPQQFASYVAASGTTISSTPLGNSQPGGHVQARDGPNLWCTVNILGNPYLNGGAAAMSRDLRGGGVGDDSRVDHAGIFVQNEGERTVNRHDVDVRGKEEEMSRAATGGTNTEFYAPERPMISEFYSGGIRD